MFPAAVPIGIKRALPGRDGNCKVLLNPGDSEVFHPGDELIVIAEDDDSYTIDVRAKSALIADGAS